MIINVIYKRKIKKMIRFLIKTKLNAYFSNMISEELNRPKRKK
jgi:hypothetical protein